MDIQQHPFDFEERTLEFSKRIVSMCKVLPKNVITTPIISQIIRSGTSVGANYREANDALGEKDFANRLKISRKEAKETTYWIDLLSEALPDYANRFILIREESVALTKILSTMIGNRLKKM